MCIRDRYIEQLNLTFLSGQVLQAWNILLDLTEFGGKRILQGHSLCFFWNLNVPWQVNIIMDLMFLKFKPPQWNHYEDGHGYGLCAQTQCTPNWYVSGPGGCQINLSKCTKNAAKCGNVTLTIAYHENEINLYGSFKKNDFQSKNIFDLVNGDFGQSGP